MKQNLKRKPKLMAVLSSANFFQNGAILSAVASVYSSKLLLSLGNMNMPSPKPAGSGEEAELLRCTFSNGMDV